MIHRNNNWLRFIFIICGIILISSCMVVDVYAFSWDDLWRTPDQQGVKSLRENDPEHAAIQFENDSWKGIANYRAGDYEQAFENFSKADSAQSDYNRGNTLAHLGQYEGAIAAYDAALEKDPNNEDAKVNRDIVQQLLDQQQNQQQQHQDQNQEQEQENNDQQSSDQSEQNGNEQQDANRSQQNDSEQQDSNQQGQQNQLSQQQQQQQENNQQNDALPQPPTGDDDPSQQNMAPNDDAMPSDEQSAQNTEDQQNDTQPQSAEQLSAQQREQQNSAEQLLRQVPDDPGGLLRQKFLRDHLRLQQQRG